MSQTTKQRVVAAIFCLALGLICLPAVGQNAIRPATEPTLEFTDPITAPQPPRQAPPTARGSAPAPAQRNGAQAQDAVQPQGDGRAQGDAQARSGAQRQGDASAQDGAQPQAPVQPPTTAQAAPPAAPAAPAPLTTAALTSGLSGLGTTRGTMSASPTMIGDLFGNGLATISGNVTVPNQFTAQGFVIVPPTLPDRSDAVLAFEQNGGTPDDFFSVGAGTDASGDGLADTFSITEPLPPNESPTSPGPGFVFDGGSVVYAPNGNSQAASDGTFSSGDLWFVSYSFTGPLGGIGGGLGGTAGLVIAGPDVATRRVKLSENFSPEPRDRCFMNYSFFNDATGGLGDISRWVWGAERRIFGEDISVEIRVPTAATYASTQTLNAASDRSFELGNITLVSKFALLRTQRTTWSAGLGVALPVAEDARLVAGANELLRIENEGVHLLPYTGLLHRLSRDTVLQLFTQLDFNTNGNPVLANLAGGPLDSLGKFNDSTLMFADVALSHTLYRGRRNDRIRSLTGNLEMHYSTTLQDADVVNGGGVLLTDLSSRFDVLNLTSGLHIQLGENLVVTPAIGVPMRSGFDEQFDYEAVVQVNYFH